MMKRSEKIKVTLRKKPISNGKRISLYLDYYPPLYDAATRESTRREFLKLYLITRPANAFDKLVPRQYLKVDDAHFMIFTEYPVSKPVKAGNNSISFYIIGSDLFSSRLIIVPENKEIEHKVSVLVQENKKDTALKPTKSSPKSAEYEVVGGQKIMVKW